MTQREPARQLPFLDLAPEPADFRSEALAGLRRPAKELPCKFFYDERGSQLFERICALDEYYPTRTEIAIMRRSMPEIAALLGPGCALVEYGSGASVKIRLLLDQLLAPAAYIPIDISREPLLAAARQLADDYPALELLPVCADYTRPLSLPQPAQPARRTVVYYPGSTIGNFHPAEAAGFLAAMRKLAGPGGGLLIGVDLKKDPLVLHAAYNDRDEVTAAFNLNLLARMNRELSANFDLSQFRHYAFYNPLAGRIEMHLASLRDQAAHVGGEEIRFKRGETIWTECSYKYHPAEFAALAAGAGLRVERVWTDERQLFSIQYLTAA
ncbi:MAG TPA: L-histidine N(alpha)-methyltransferase [Herpetosiphonaceae bacterium]